MAIDSAEKRKSASSLYTGFYPVSVTPNSSKDREWRQQAGWGYSGISAGGAVRRRRRGKLSLGLGFNK